MLYVTTRNNRDAYTSNHALRENRGPDGGLYLPFRAPRFSREEIDALKDKSFGQCVAEVLNLLFGTKLTAWDVDFCVGRYPVRLESLRHRIVMAECWHNPQWNFEWLISRLLTRIRQEEGENSSWAKIAVRIAVLFGIFSELKRCGIAEAVDISVVSGDFTAPISAWYARQWGLPIGNIICCCNENNTLWDLFAHGQMRTDAVSIPTAIPEADVTLPECLEHLIYECGGTLEVQRYLERCRSGRSYIPNEGILFQLRKGQYVSVVSSSRLETAIPSVYRTHGYLMSPYTALAYSGLLDYRAKTGETRHALVLADRSPACDASAAAAALGISERELRTLL